MGQDELLGLGQIRFLLCLLQRVLYSRVCDADSLVFESLFLFGLGRLGEVRQVAALPVDDDLLGDVVEVGLAAPEQLAGLDAELLQEVLGVFPFVNAINILNILSLDFFKDGVDVLRRVRHLLGSDHALEHLLRVRLVLVVHDTRAVDQVNSLCQGDVLPRLGFSRNGRHSAACLLHESIDH